MENGEKKTVSRTVIEREVIMRKYHVHIKNFRNLKDVKVTLSPLTILTGENGSGKSTFFKALLFLKHNHTHEAAKKLKYVIDDDINLGGWDQIANDPKKPISIKITEETWGYDHQVEEVYDIDNCPFELNPTEEYAEKLWEKAPKDIHTGRFEYTIYRVSETKIPACTITQKRSLKEYIYSWGKLSEVKLGIDNSEIICSIGYLVAPFDGYTEQIDNLFDPTAIRPYFISINSVQVKNKIIDNLFRDVVRFIFYKFAKMRIWGPVNKPEAWPELHKKFDENFLQTFCEPFALRKNSVLRYYAGVFISMIPDDDVKKHLIQLTNTFLKLIDSDLEEYFPSLYEIVSMGTIREIPKSRYLEEAINDELYYGIFRYLKNRDEIIDRVDRAMSEYHLESFQLWLKKFEFGNAINFLNVNQVVKIQLTNLEEKDIPLAEASSGALQLIPVLFLLCINVNNFQMFSIQQPELHLHPRLHSILAEFIVEQVSPLRRKGAPVWEWFESEEQVQASTEQQHAEEFGTKNDSLPKLVYRKRQTMEFITVPTHLIIETHSEHLLKKLQVMVSQGKTVRLWPQGSCSGEDVALQDALSIYYFAKDAKGNTRAIELELDDNGFFKTETPKGFFDESLDLNRQLLLGRN